MQEIVPGVTRFVLAYHVKIDLPRTNELNVKLRFHAAWKASPQACMYLHTRKARYAELMFHRTCRTAVGARELQRRSSNLRACRACSSHATMHMLCYGLLLCCGGIMEGADLLPFEI